ERGRERKMNGESEDEQRPEHELGHRKPDQGDHGDHRVGELPSEERRERREDEGDREVEDEGEDAEKERVLRARADRGGDGLVVHERAAEVAASDVADPDAVPLPDRVVEVEVLAEDLALLRGGLATEHALGVVTREDAREQENERRDDEQRADGKCEALGDESENQTSSCKEFMDDGLDAPP